jgi:hypothetical protein
MLEKRAAKLAKNSQTPASATIKKRLRAVLAKYPLKKT